MATTTKDFTRLDVARWHDARPTDHHKSFYGKATIATLADGTDVLVSYGTPVVAKTTDGKMYKVQGGDWWATTTTLRHIKAFCGINKAQALALDMARVAVY